MTKKQENKDKSRIEKENTLKETSRFYMTKQHHKNTYNEAKTIGRMDFDLIPLCDYVLTTKNYFTSSSCSGRIALIGLGKKETKQESAFYRKWHRIVNTKEVLEAVKNYKGHVLWFKQEPLILHLGTNNIENAKKILNLCEKVGVKRAGIKVAKNGKFIVEILGTQNITTPIKEGKVSASEEYLKYLIKKGNQKFKKNQELIKKLFEEAKKDLK
jgi:tRNA wybutosine-synthesizing protein 3